MDKNLFIVCCFILVIISSLFCIGNLCYNSRSEMLGRRRVECTTPLLQQKPQL